MASGNPLVSQGTINRIRGSITWDAFSNLNITAPFLDKDGISMTLEGKTVTYLSTLTGACTSPEPYQMVTFTAALLKTQPLAGLYKAQMELLALLGNCTVRPDSQQLPPYDFLNCSLSNVGTLRFNGTEAVWGAEFQGFYLINASLFDQTT